MKKLRYCLLMTFMSGFFSYALAADAYMGKVTRILDGDTLEVVRSTGESKQIERIRLSGIDAPESSQDYGQASKQALAGLCFGRVARVEPLKHDRYGRTLASVNCDGVDASRVMVASGMAWVYTKYNTDASMVNLERKAKQDRLGLWSMASPVPPWSYRREH